MKGLKKLLVTTLSVMMVLTSVVPSFAVEDVRVPALKVKPVGDNSYSIYQIAVPSEDDPEICEWGDGITTKEKLLSELGDPEGLISTLEDVDKADDPDALIRELAGEYDKYLVKDNAIAPTEGDENKYELPYGLYLLTDEDEFYQPEFFWFEDEDMKLELIELPKEEEAAAEETAEEPQAEEETQTEEPAEDQAEEPSETAESASETEESKAEEEAPAPEKKASLKANKAPALKAADNEWIERFTTTFSRGAEDVDGQLVWTPTNANADHRFVYRVNYAFSGEFELPAGSVEIRVPKQLLRDRNGAFDDYYDIALPLEEDADEDTKFVYEEDGDELRIWNIVEISAGESGTIEVSYLTKDKTFYYEDMAAHDPFYADIEVTNSGQTVTAHADAPPVHINTNAVISKTDKRVPTLFRTWSNTWGETPADAADYYYIKWEIRTSLNKDNTQPYDFTLEDTFDDGDVVAYKFEEQSSYSTNNTIRNVYQRSNERYDYVITRHLKSDFKDLENYTVWNNITATVHPVDLLDPDTQATDREPFYYEKPVYRYPPGRFYADKFGQYTDTYTTGFETSSYGIVQDSEDISDYGLEEFVAGDTDRLNDEHLKYYTYVRGYPYPWTLPDGEIGDDPYQYGTEPVKYELWDETIDIEDNEPLVGGEDYEFSQLHFIFNFEKAVFNEETMQFDTSAATASDFTEDNNVIFYAKKVGDEEYVKIGELAPGTNTWSNVNSSYVNRVGPNDIYFKSDVIGYKLETSNALWYTCLRAYPHLTLFRNEKTLSQIGSATTVRIDNTAYIHVTDHNGNELFPGDAENSKGDSYSEGMVNSDYVRKVLRQSNIQKYVTGTRNNKAKKTYTVTWRINMEESYTDNLGRHQIEQGGGTFFDLCPLGSHADKKSVVVYDNGTRLNSSNYDVSVEPNYNDTGRDLLVIKIKKPGTKYSFYYDTIHEWEDLSQVNFKIFNSVAYETGNSRIAEGYPDDGGIGRDKALLADLDPDSDASRFIYSQDWHDVDLVVSTSTGINKKVRAEEDEKYSYDTMTYVNGNYSYRWRVANDEITRLKDIILFDSMENFTKASEDIESDWRGYVQSVDTAMLREQGIFPVVYYSSLEDMDIYEHHDLNEMIDGEKVWKTKAEFGDISNAKAIAIDCSKALDGTDFVLGQGESIETFVNMKAPSQGMDLGRIPYSYNNIFLSSTKIDDLDQEHPDLIHQDYTRIGYKVKGDIDFYKVDKKDHENRISGIAFMLYGKSDYGTDVELEAVSDSNGYVRFNDVEQGTYQIRELGGSADWQVDRELKTVTIDKDGVATIDGLSKDGLVNRYYVWENEARIHADMDFIKKSANRPSEELSVISAIRGVRPGSTETVTIDGNEYYVLASDSDEALLMAKDAETSLSSFTGWNDSAIRTYLNGDYFNDKPVLAALNAKHAVKTRRPESFENYTSTDEKAFILTQADISGFTGDEEASIDDYSAKQTILPNSILRSLSGTFVLRNPYSEGEAAVCNASTGEISAESSVLMPKYYPVIKVDIGDRVNVTIPDTEFTVSGTSDYGNEVYETAVTNNSGKLVIRNLEQGTYKLIETRANEDYVPNSTEYTVIVDKNGLVSIFNGSEQVETNGSSYIIRNYPKYHSFSILKTDKENGQWLQGATFHLYGTSDTGTPVDITGTTGTNGRVEFANLEAGTYLIKETAAPDKHMIDPVSHILTIQDNGMISISGINKENGTFDWRNERAYDGKIVITKIWKDNKEDSERPTPKVTIKTEKPASALQAYAVFDSSTGTLTFFRDEPGKYTGIKTFGTKTVYATSFETDVPDAYGGYTPPWASQRYSIRSIVMEDPIMPLSTAHWFQYCSNLTSVDLTLLDTSNVTNMRYMFQGCSNLASADLSGWDTSKVTDMYYMFSECYKLSDLSINDWDVGNVTNMYYMFNYCGNSASVPGTLDISNWDPKKLTNMNYMFYSCGFASIDMSGWELDSLTSIDDLFSYSQKLQTANLSGWTANNLTSLTDLFYYCYALRSVDASNWEMHNLTNVSSLITACNALTSLDVSGWDAGNITNMQQMFQNCNALTSLDLSGIDTSNVTNMYAMFYGCNALTSLDVSGFDTSNVTNMGYMFYGCNALTSLDLSGWDTSSATNMSYMFNSCFNMTNIYVSELWDTSAVTSSSNMFGNCGELPNFNASYTDKTKAHYNEGGYLTYKAAPSGSSGANIIPITLLMHKLGVTGFIEKALVKLGILQEAYAAEDTATVTFDSGTDGTFEGGSTTNVVEYELVHTVPVKYAHTPNVSDTGVKNSNYANNLSNTQVVTIDGASKLKVDIYYNGENVNYDWLSVWKGNYPSYTAYSNRTSTGYVTTADGAPNNNNKFGGSQSGTYTVNGNSLTRMGHTTLQFSGNTVTFGFRSDGSGVGQGYGYYAIVTGLDSTGNQMSGTTLGEIISGEYKEPIANDPEYRFGGWSPAITAISSDATVAATYEEDLISPQAKGTYDGVDWKIKSDGTLVIGKAGETQSFADTSNRTSSSWPWYQYRSQIKNVEFAGPVNGNGSHNGMFSGCSQLIDFDTTNFNTSNVTNMANMFYSCSKLTSLDLSSWDTGSVTNMNSMFSNCTALEDFDVSGFDTSNVTDMGYMFSSCSKLTSLDLSDWDTGSATTMSNMFYNCNKLASLDISGWDTSNVTNMQSMFCGCNALTSLDVSGWDTGSVTNMSSMFASCRGLTSLDLSDWDTGSVTNMSYMFQYCSGLTSLDVSGWDTGNVTNMSGMFYGCSGLTSLDLSSWDTGSVTNMSSMFYNCSALTSLDVSGWDTGSVTNMSYMFYNCSALTSLDLSGWDTGSVTNMSSMFQDCRGLTSLDLSDWDTGSVTNMSSMFYNCSALTSLDVSGWDTGSVTDMRNMFGNCSGLTSLDVSGFDTGSVTNMQSMFSGCSGLTSLNISNFDTSKVQNMGYMFQNCSGLTSLDVSGFDTSRVYSMSSMFYGCSGLTSLDLSSWDTGNATDMGYMFQNCSGLTSLDVSGFDTSKVQSMAYMFQNCSSLTSLDVSGFDTSKVTTMSSMFQNCSGLTNIDVSNFDTSRVQGMGAMFSGCTSLRSIDISGFTTNMLSSVDHMFEDCSSLTSLDLSHLDLLNGTNVTSMLKGCDSLEKLVLGPGLNTASGRGNTQVELPGNWQRIANLNGRKLSEPGPLLTSAELFSTYDGFDDNGIYLKEGADDQQYDIKDNEAYTSVDENWVKNGDGTWTYTFNVYDDEAEFYGYEDLMNGYDVEYDENNQFIINEDGTVTKSITITNTSTDTASLSVTKTVNGNNLKPTDTSRDFEFKITLTNDNTSLFEGVKEYGGVVYKDGVAVFKLKHGDTMNFTKLPLDTSYVIEETPVDGFNSTITNSEGLLETTDVVNVQAVNTKTDVELRNITIAKTIEGSISENEEFSYRVVLKGLEAKSEYTMYNSTTGETETITSDALGAATAEFTLKGGKNAVFSNLPVGATYTVTENGGDYDPSYTVVDANEQGTIAKASDSETEGQSLATAKETVDTGEDVTVTFTNKRTVTQEDTIDISLVKKAQGSDEVLSGATFNLSGTSENQEDIDITMVSDSDGKLTFRKIENGTYQLKETKAPAGYILDQTVYTVTVQNGTAEITGLTRVDGNFVVYNTPVPTADFSFRKTDSVSGTPLSGARFSISDGSTVVDRKASDDNGIVSFEGLEFKTYTLREIEAPEGYELSDEEYTVTLTSGSPATVEITDSSGDPVQKDGDTYVISNTRKTVAFTLKKNVAGGMGDHVNPFVFSYILTDAAANATYTATNGAETVEIATDSTGSATGTLQLSDGGNFHIEGLPSGAKIITTETANDHTASYSAAVGRYSKEGQNETFNTALSTEELQLNDSATVVFTNVRMSLSPTGVAKLSKGLIFTVLALSAALYVILRRKKQITE